MDIYWGNITLQVLYVGFHLSHARTMGANLCSANIAQGDVAIVGWICCYNH
jgi:hypothetical protein